MTRLFALSFGLMLMLAVPVHAGSIEVANPQIRATAPGMQATGGYLIITNHGDVDDRLVSATADFAAHVELHEMIQDGDIMRMRRREGGVTVPAGGKVMLRPGGLHLMLMGLTETMAAGEMRNVTLTFASGHSVTLSAMVMKPGEIGGKGQSNTHAAGNHN